MKKVLIGLFILGSLALAESEKVYFEGVESKIFITQYQANEVKFNRTMKGKTIGGTGKVKQVTETFGTVFVHLNNGFLLAIDENYIDIAMELVKGDTIKYVGYVDTVGIFGDAVHIEKTGIKKIN
ncbi:MAG: hypothetical protein ACRCZ0_07905 [Cetobacterium sp.]